MSDNTFNANDTPKKDGNHPLDFPTRMNDGRQFTDFRSSCYYNLPEQDMTTYKYRQFLKHNAEKIIKNNQVISNYISVCSTCSDNEIASSYLGLTCTGEECKTKINDHSGVGDYYVDNH